MRYITSLAIILGILFISEMFVELTKLPIPGSILGMLTLFVGLKLGIIKLDKVDETGNLLLDNMLLMFIPLGAGIMTSVDMLDGYLGRLLIIIVVTTVLTVAATGVSVQMMMRGNDCDLDY